MENQEGKEIETFVDRDKEIASLMRKAEEQFFSNTLCHEVFSMYLDYMNFYYGANVEKTIERIKKYERN